MQILFLRSFKQTVSQRTELDFSPSLVTCLASQTLMNVQRKLTTAHLTRTAQMRMERSSVHASWDLQEMGKRAMVGSNVQCLQSKKS